MNQGLVRDAGGEWNGNLDAFNDYLSWPDEESYELVFLGAEHCESVLGHRAQADWLRDNMSKCHPSNEESVRARLAIAQQGQGETLYDVIRDIILDKAHVRFVES